MIIGAITGGIGGLGNTALSEETWQKGIGHGFEGLLLGMLRGAGAGAATSAVTSPIEDIGGEGGPVGAGMQKQSAGVGVRKGLGGEIRHGCRRGWQLGRGWD